MTDSDYDYILEEIGSQDKIEFEIDVEVYSDEKGNQCYHFKWILYVFISYLYNNFHQIFIYFLIQHQFYIFDYKYVCNVI